MISFKCEQEAGYYSGCDPHVRAEDYNLGKIIGPLRASYPHPDIDVAFIELSEQFRDHMTELQREFLSTGTDTDRKEGDAILVIQYPWYPSGQMLSYSIEQVSEELSTASTQPGSSGSPILLIRKKEFAVHRGVKTDCERNLVIKIQSLIDKLIRIDIKNIPRAPCSPEKSTLRMSKSL